MLAVCAFDCQVHSAESDELGSLPRLKARVNAALRIGGVFETTGGDRFPVALGETGIKSDSGRTVRGVNHLGGEATKAFAVA